MWYSKRLIAGFRYAEECAKCDMIDEAFNCLDDIVTLYEKFYSLPAGTVLTFRCDELSELRITLTDGICMPIMFTDETKKMYKCLRAEEEDFGVNMMIQKEEMRSTNDPYHLYCPQYDIYHLVAKYGWEGFDPIRDDPRFIACVERMMKYVVRV